MGIQEAVILKNFDGLLFFVCFLNVVSMPNEEPNKGLELKSLRWRSELRSTVRPSRLSHPGAPDGAALKRGSMLKLE